MPGRVGFDIAGEFGPEHEIVRIIVAEAAEAGQGAAVDEQFLTAAEVGLVGKALKRGLAVVEADQRAPLIREIVLHLDLLAGGLGHDRPVARLAEEGVDIDHAELAVDGRRAAVEGDFLAGGLQFVDDPGVLPQLHRERGEEAAPFDLHLVAEALAILVEADQPHPDIAAGAGLQNRLKIKIGAIVAV